MNKDNIIKLSNWIKENRNSPIDQLKQIALQGGSTEEEFNTALNIVNLSEASSTQYSTRPSSKNKGVKVTIYILCFLVLGALVFYVANSPYSKMLRGLYLLLPPFLIFVAFSLLLIKFNKLCKDNSQVEKNETITKKFQRDRIAILIIWTIIIALTISAFFYSSYRVSQNLSSLELFAGLAFIIYLLEILIYVYIGGFSLIALIYYLIFRSAKKELLVDIDNKSGYVYIIQKFKKGLSLHFAISLLVFSATLYLFIPTFLLGYRIDKEIVTNKKIAQEARISPKTAVYSDIKLFKVDLSKNVKNKDIAALSKMYWDKITEEEIAKHVLWLAQDQTESSYEVRMILFTCQKDASGNEYYNFSVGYRSGDGWIVFDILDKTYNLAPFNSSVGHDVIQGDRKDCLLLEDPLPDSYYTNSNGIKKDKLSPTPTTTLSTNSEDWYYCDNGNCIRRTSIIDGITYYSSSDCSDICRK